jgi:hypothetical protein
MEEREYGRLSKGKPTRRDGFVSWLSVAEIDPQQTKLLASTPRGHDCTSSLEGFERCGFSACDVGRGLRAGRRETTVVPATTGPSRYARDVAGDCRSPARTRCGEDRDRADSSRVLSGGDKTVKLWDTAHGGADPHLRYWPWWRRWAHDLGPQSESARVGRANQKRTMPV